MRHRHWFQDRLQEASRHHFLPKSRSLSVPLPLPTPAAVNVSGTEPHCRHRHLLRLLTQQPQQSALPQTVADWWQRAGVVRRPVLVTKVSRGVRPVELPG